MPRPRTVHSRYPKGEIAIAGIEIVANDKDNTKGNYYGTQWRYRVIHTCCLTFATLQHDTIKARIKNKTRYCQRCASINSDAVNRDKPQSYDYDKWVTPSWSVPESLRGCS